MTETISLEARLFQLFHQFAGKAPVEGDDKLRFIAQNAISTSADMNKWLVEVQKEHPLPEGYQWFLCNEDSEHFLRTHARKESMV